jgi:signal transduction histidine kinase
MSAMLPVPEPAVVESGEAGTRPQTRLQRWLQKLWLPPTMLGRITLVLALGVLCAQGLGSWLWASQIRSSARADADAAASHIATSAAGTIRYFSELPVKFRPILIEQLRTMGGTRFFVNVNAAPVDVQAVPSQPLADLVVARLQRELRAALPQLRDLRVALAPPEGLAVSPDGTRVQDLPESWTEATLLTRPRPAPLLVIQAEFEPGGWLYLATRMPDPYFLDNANPLTLDRVALQAVTLLTVLLLVTWLVRNLTRPLERIARVASSFGQAMHTERLPETGSAELQRTARAFNDMQSRIQKYVEDRNRLFAGISHDLKTPITRLKLRTELLDDEALQADFHEDLDELDEMVKSALQALKDSDIHENLAVVRLDVLMQRLAAPALRGGAAIHIDAAAVSVRAKPLALKRALANLLDNALRYGDRVELRVAEREGRAEVVLRDHGPGVPPDALATLFEPYVRLAHGQQRNASGSGLGLGIARDFITTLGGELTLANHVDGGLVATVTLPLADADSTALPG